MMDMHQLFSDGAFPSFARIVCRFTLFIYPSAILETLSYAMTWDRLRELSRTALFDHPIAHLLASETSRQREASAVGRRLIDRL
jgi:hypothetical protein